MKRVAASTIDFLMNRSLFTKIFISIILTAILGIGAIIIVHQHYFQRLLFDLEKQQLQRSIEQSSTNLNNRIDQIRDDMFHFIARSNQGRNILNAEYNELVYTEDMKNIASSLGAFESKYPGEVDSVFFYRGDGAVFASYSHVIDRSENYSGHPWHTYFLTRQREVWISPTRETIFRYRNDSPAPMLGMNMLDVMPLDGIFVVHLHPELFEQAFRHIEHPRIRIQLKDRNGHWVYAGEESLQVNDPQREYFEISKDYFTVHVTLDHGVILNKVREIQTLNILVIASIIAFALLIAIILSHSLTRPLRQLLSMIQRVETGDFTVHTSPKYKDEIGRISKAFNQMVRRVSELVNTVYLMKMEKLKIELRQKEAKIKMLQSQINPHFLYNTLEVMNCQAIVHQVPALSKMSQSLARFFQYSIDKKEIVVPIFKEIEHVKTYLEIQEERYPDIEVCIDVDPEIYSKSLIKLTLQPIIENCFAHGFKKDEDYWIRVSSSVHDNHISLYVEDNGVGMSESDMVKLNRRFAEYSQKTDPESSPDESIGLINVHERLVLYFGRSFGLSMLKGEQGVKVKIMLPKEWEGPNFENHHL